MFILTYEELMTAELGISTKHYQQCGLCACTGKVHFYYIKNKSIPNEINVRCEECIKNWRNYTQLDDKEVFLIKLRDDFN